MTGCVKAALVKPVHQREAKGHTKSKVNTKNCISVMIITNALARVCRGCPFISAMCDVMTKLKYDVDTHSL